MKKILTVLCLVAILLGCNNDDALTGFEMPYIRTFEIFAGLNTFETHIFTFNNIDSEYASFLTNNGTLESDVTRIIPKYFRLTNLGGNITFEDISRVRLFITMPDGSLEKEIAFLEPVPLDIGYQMTLVPTLADVKTIVESGAFNLLLKINYRSIPTQSIDAQLSLSFQAITE